MKVRVLIADDQDLVRAGLRTVLEAETDIEVVGEAANGAEAVDLASRTRPDVVLMDIRMPELDGIEATRRLRERGAAHEPRVLILTTFDLDEYVFGALRAGASGFLLKDVPPEELAAAIRVIAKGDALLAPAVTGRLIARFAEAPDPVAARVEIESLTQRELEVIKLVARGLSNAEIAAELVVEETTVKTHVRHVLQKLGLRDRVQAAVAAYEAGLMLRPSA